MDHDILGELRPVFYPRSVAVLGASNTPRKPGNTYVASMQELGFPAIYPVNPREQQVLGLKSYSSVLDIPDEVEHAIITLPFEAALAAVEECAQKNVRVAVLNTSGFAEKGAAGAMLQAEIVEKSRARGMRIIGPNCMGVHNVSSGLTFDIGMLGRHDGPVGVISHSGSMTDFITRSLLSRDIACGKVVSSGNDADLTAADFLEYYGADPNVRLVAGYLEGVTAGRHFFEVARRVSQRKPVLLVKGGATERGARAAASHTGSLAGSADLWRALYRQAGMPWLSGVEDLTDAAFALWSQPLPRGPRVVIIATPGGVGVLATDACIQAGLTLAELSPETKVSVRRLVGDLGTSADNPIDLGMSARYRPEVHLDASIAADQDPGVDMIVVIARAGTRRDYVEQVVESGRGVTKTFVVALVGQPEDGVEDIKTYAAAGIPAFYGMDHTARALRGMLDYARFLRRTGNEQRLESFRGVSRG